MANVLIHSFDFFSEGADKHDNFSKDLGHLNILELANTLAFKSTIIPPLAAAHFKLPQILFLI